MYGRENAPVYVIGAANIDLTGTPGGHLRPGDSNPGKVTLSPGGVGRNIAENLRLLGREVSLITVLGDDLYGEQLRNHCRNAGIDTRYSLTDPLGRTSTYLCITDEDGELNVAISDMAIQDQLTPRHLAPLVPMLNEAALVIADANVPEESLRFLAQNVTAPLAADPVSVAKAGRLRPLLSRLTLVKPNVPEAELLTGLSIRGDGDLGRAAEALHQSGVRRVYLSLGARGVWADDPQEGGALLPCMTGPIVNTTGCGDAFVSAAADAFLLGMGTLEAARYALAAAALCAEDPAAVNPRLSRGAVELKMNPFV